MMQCLTFAASPEEDAPPGLLIEETTTCVEKMKLGKADGNPAELYDNDTATLELHHVTVRFFETAVVPGDFVLGEMLDFSRKQTKMTE